MKIILTQEVSGLGTPGDIVEVKDGLRPQLPASAGLRHPWTKGGEKQVTLDQAGPLGPGDPRPRPRQRGQGPARGAQGLAARPAPARAGACSARSPPAEVQEAVKAAGGPDLDKRRIELPGHIKSVGQYQVQVRLHTDVTATFGLSVVASK